jgi:hypothetical protein
MRECFCDLSSCEVCRPFVGESKEEFDLEAFLKEFDAEDPLKMDHFRVSLLSKFSF